MILAFAVLCVLLFGLCAFTLASTVCICSLDIILFMFLDFFVRFMCSMCFFLSFQSLFVLLCALLLFVVASAFASCSALLSFLFAFCLWCLIDFVFSVMFCVFECYSNNFLVSVPLLFALAL